MTCRELEQFLTPYLDGEFGPEERIEFERHLAECPVCARKVHQETSFRETLRLRAREAARLPAPASLRDSVRVGLRLEQRRAAVTQWMRLSAAALVVVAAGSAWWHFRPPARQRFLDDATRWYSKRLPHESQPGTPEQAEAWFINKLDHRVSAPHLADATLDGVRLLSVLDRPAAYISYKTVSVGAPGRRVGVFVFADDGRDVEAESLPSVLSNRGYHVAIWREDSIVYELVSDLDEEDIHRLLAQLGARPTVINPTGESAQHPAAVPPGALDVLPVEYQPAK